MKLAVGVLLCCGVALAIVLLMSEPTPSQSSRSPSVGLPQVDDVGSHEPGAMPAGGQASAGADAREAAAGSITTASVEHPPIGAEPETEVEAERRNRRFLLERSLEQFRALPADDPSRYQNIIMLSIATILDQSGNYIVPEDGVPQKIDLRDGFLHFAAQERLYKVRPGEFPEYDEFSRWRLAMSEARDEEDRTRRVVRPLPQFDSTFEPLILSRVEEALRLVDPR